MHRRAFLLSALAAAQDLTFRAEVRLVNLSFAARDANGRLVSDLRREEIEVLEDGEPQKIEAFFKAGDVPLSLGLVMDASGSQSGFAKQHRNDIKTFLRTVLKPGRDLAFITGFGNRVRLAADFQLDADALLDGFEEYQKKASTKPEIGHRISRSGGTAFYDAVYHSIREKLAKVDAGRRRALLIFSDGEDNASEFHMLDTIQAAQTENVVLFSIHYLESRKEPDARNLYGARVMERLSEDTGGLYFDAAKKDLRPAFREIEDTLRSSYELAYRSSNLQEDGTFRKIRIRSLRPGVTLRHRSGYFPKSKAAGA